MPHAFLFLLKLARTMQGTEHILHKRLLKETDDTLTSPEVSPVSVEMSSDLQQLGFPTCTQAPHTSSEENGGHPLYAGLASLTTLP